MSASSHALSASERVNARDRLLQRIKDNADLPALGSAVTRVIQLASSANEARGELAHFILADVALTQKILRLANSVSYRNAGERAITTVSTAVFALGFDTVKTTALAMLLADRIAGARGGTVRAELCNAVRASIIARELAARSHIQDIEEAAIAALFKNIGRILIAAHDHALYTAIADLCTDGGHSVVEASVQVLNCSLESLGETVLREWLIPDPILQALAPLPAGAVRPTKSRRDWLQQAVTFSAALAPVLTDETARQPLLARFAEALRLDEGDLDNISTRVQTEFELLAPPALVGNPDASVAVRLIPSDALHRTAPATEPTRHPSGKPLAARNLLLEGLNQIAEMRAAGASNINKLLLLALETLQHSLGCRSAALYLRDAAGKHYRARIAIGANSAAVQADCQFATQSSRDLFHLAIDNGVDLFIADANEPKIQSLIPDWHRAVLPDARSLVLLPLIVAKKPIGLLYAERPLCAPEGMPKDEAALVTALKSQLLAALGAR